MGTVSPSVRDLITSAAAALSARVEEVNRLNVFPVPDGDTGTNMSLTMNSVVDAVVKLDPDATLAEVLHAVTHGSLMGARGNSGVILSQILRGLCEGVDAEAASFGPHDLARALEHSTTVAYQAVRKPVEGTMLTVVKDIAAAGAEVAGAGLDLSACLERVSAAAFESVKRTPELLPVLKENNVVDAGGFGLAILAEGFVGAATGRDVVIADVSRGGEVSIELADDWDDDEYLYCTEFLLFGDDIDRDAVNDYVSSVGGSELVVGDNGSYKVHVHTDDPGGVLAYATSLGEVAEVHVNNMRQQTAARDAGLKAQRSSEPAKPVGVVAVASGSGIKAILESLGVDVVISGGQTMNPSTADIVQAVSRVNAEKVLVLPNNKNILMAANAAVGVADRPVGVVPTRSIPQAFSALLAKDLTDDLDALVAEMTEAAAAVRTGEITTAVKDAKGVVGEIHQGDVIGIVDDEDIVAVGSEVEDVALSLAAQMVTDETDAVTLLAGEGFSDERLNAVVERLEELYPEVSIEPHRGEQPLYPLIMSAE